MSPRIDADVFGTNDADRIASAVAAFCRRELGAGVAAFEFTRSSVASVHGVRLADGRRVVVKAYRSSEDLAHLEAVQDVQRRLVAGGYPAPAPLLGPTTLAAGVAVVEHLLDEGVRVDGHEAAGRALIASALADFVRCGRSLRGLAGLGRLDERTALLWREPHDRRFDFPGTAAGAEWIDALGAEARRRLDGGAGDLVVGHADWRTEHLRFDAERLTAVYDWDSVLVGPEPWFVGAAAHAFTVDWSVGQLRRFPSLDDSLAFVEDYEAARGRPFPTGERVTATTALVASIAYGARCEHSDACTDMGTRSPRAAPPVLPRHGYRASLALHGPRLLRVAPDGVPPLAEA